MRSPGRLLGAGALVAFAATGVSAQVRQEWGGQVTAATGRPAFVGMGPVWAWRPGLRDRLLLHGAVGGAEHQVALRLEATWQLLISPRTERGVGAYIGGGLAGQFADTHRGWLLAAIGIEQAPGGTRGWVAEIGLGGGFRVAVGYRWRKGREGLE